MSADSNVYTAERILKKRLRDGVLEYQLTWQGYSSRENTWEPAENILDGSLITSFEKSSSKKIKRSSNLQTAPLPAVPPANSNVNIDVTNTSITTNTSSPNTSLSINTSTGTSTGASTSTNASARSPAASTSNATTTTTSPKTTTTISTNTIDCTTDIDVDDNKTPIAISCSTSTSNNNNNINNNSSIINVFNNTNGTYDTDYSESVVNESKILNGSHSPAAQNNVSRKVSSRTGEISFEQSLPTPSNHSGVTKSSRRSALLNTVITDVTINDQTITISESKTNHGFFKERVV